ncbi:exopolysaccharide biosynthesis polyprenyl glycosylphosphotransferase [Sphingomonas daechungensis]|uniref:exopolysaccharide biosynthesis polyprenyl glycosylphosphotransferase n=1 Tax=Sphingomonas daechungensis TaxID=1176646 RepID=UPI003783BCE1
MPDDAALSQGNSESAGARPAGDRRPRVRFTSNIVGPIFLLADFICLAISVPIALVSYSFLVGVPVNYPVHIFALAVLIAAFLLIRSSRRAYRRTLVDLMHEEGDALVDATVASLLASALVWQFGLIENYSRGVSLLYLLSLLVCLAISRPLIRIFLTRMASSGAIEQRIAFYGADPQSVAMIRRLLTALDLPHLRFVGVADDRPKIEALDDLKLIGGYEDLAELARRGEVDQVLISVPNLPPQRLHDIVDGLSAVSVDVSLIPPEAIELAPDYRVHLLGSLPVLNLWQRPFRDVNQFVKRGEDFLLGGIALVFLAPLMGIAALLIRMTSPGPILFVQPRVGFNNEVIDVYKFRTMYADQTDLGARATTTKDDPRVTPVGKILRKLSIDELPQLFNVIRGDMSLVGPRPHALEMRVGDRYYQDAVRGYAGRHRVRPGITGLAQVKGLRGEIRTVERAKRRVELDKEYIDRWSLWLDLHIMLATVRAVFFDRDAY